MLPLGDVTVNYLDSPDDIAVFLRWLGERRSVLSLDTETTGLKWWLPNFKVRLAQFGDVDTAFVMRADRFGVLVEDVIKKYEGLWSGSNFMSFDYHALTKAGFSFPRAGKCNDTLLMSKLNESDQFDHSLKGRASRHFGPLAVFGQQMLHEAFAEHGLRENSEEAWALIPYEAEAYTLYSGVDTIIDAREYEYHLPGIQQNYADAYAREMSSWEVSRNYEHRGLRVDLVWANKLHDEMSQEIEILQTQLASLGIPNPNARMKIADMLIDEGWVPREYSKKSGKPKLDKSVLQGLDHEAVAPLLEYSRLVKWRKTYVERVINDAYNGRVYPSINQAGAKTFRKSYQGIPLHQMPSRHPDAWKIRRMFLPEEGERWVSIDAAAQEDRLSTHFSNDPNMRKIFDDKLDKHIFSASGVYQVPYDQVTTEQRSLVKNWSYAAAYGAQDPKLAKMLGVSVEEVAVIRQRVNSTFERFHEYSQELEQQGKELYHAERCAYVRGVDGRRIYADQGKYGEPKYYQLVNYRNQSTGAIMLKENLNKLAASGLDEHVIMDLHDELGVSVPAGPEGQDIAEEIGRVMQFKQGDTSLGAELSIDFPTSVGEQTEYWSGH